MQVLVVGCEDCRNMCIMCRKLKCHGYPGQNERTTEVSAKLSNEPDTKRHRDLANVLNGVINGEADNKQTGSAETVLVTSTMTGKEFTIKRSDVIQLAGRNYIRHSQYDPSLADIPILLRFDFNMHFVVYHHYIPYSIYRYNILQCHPRDRWYYFTLM